MTLARAKAIRRSLVKIGGIVGLVLCTFGCVEGEQPSPGDETLTIDLRWIEGFSQESRSHVETGLLWTLSYLGAGLPLDEPFLLSWRANSVTLRLDHGGIDPGALPSWRRLLAAMKASEEYRRMGALDIGRFVALTLCSVRHYYALTGASVRYEEARAQYTFDPTPVAIVESSVAFGNRLVEVAEGSAVGDIAFIAHEGTGSVLQGTFRIAEHELLDVMPNGQLRFVLYDMNGARKDAASDTLTAAGKPSKCLWCHESQLSRPFAGRTSVAGYHSLSTFERQLSDRSERLRIARALLRSRINFAHDQDHTYAELLYLAFYEPSAERLAGEWDLPVGRVQEMLSGLPTHAHAEFPFLGDELYRRSQVDALALYGVIEVPTDPRERSDYEPDLLQ